MRTDITRDQAFEEWLAALRSGEYKQGQSYLKIKEDETKHCCLGVLCEVLGLQEDEYRQSVLDDLMDEDEDEDRMQIYSFGGNIETTVLPTEVIEFMNITYAGHIKDNDRHLANMNDDGSSFAEIAFMIEDAWKNDKFLAPDHI